MKELPKFRIVEDWGTDGDVSIWFDDDVSYDLQKDIANRLNWAINTMNPLDSNQRCIHKLTKAVEQYFQFLIDNNELRKSPITKKWIWSKDARFQYPKSA